MQIKSKNEYPLVVIKGCLFFSINKMKFYEWLFKINNTIFNIFAHKTQ